MKVLPLLFFLILSFSQGLNAKETCGLQEPGFSHWAEKFVDGAKEFGLALLGGARAEAGVFCEDPQNSETCSHPAVFYRHMVTDSETLKKTTSFAGRLEPIDNVRSSASPVDGTTTAFLFKTKECPQNRFVMTNAHFKYDLQKGAKKYFFQEARFCLNSSDGKKWSCYPVDMREKNIVSGWPLGRGVYIDDYLVAPLMGKKDSRPSSEVVPTLVTLDLDDEKGKKLRDGEGLYYSGYHSILEKMYSGTGCKISKYGGIIKRHFSHHEAQGSRPLVLDKWVINHSCPTIGGFSGSPLFYFDDEGKPKAFGVHFGGFRDGGTLKKYNPMKYHNNDGFKFTSGFIKMINEYCKSYLKRNPQ